MIYINKLKNKLIILPILLFVISFIGYFLIFGSNTNLYKPYTSFLTDIEEKNISTIYLSSSSQIRVKLWDGLEYSTDNPRKEDFKEELLLKNITVKENMPLDFKKALLILLISILFISSINYYKKKSSNSKKIESIELKSINKTSCTFQSIAGNYEVKDSVKDIIAFLKNPEKFTYYKAKMPKGILLYGDPGTGKTLIARAIASEANVPFFSVSGSDFVEVYVGVGASRIRQLFKKASESKKAVIFIDEIDAIGKKRSNDSSNGERDQTLNALLTQMSGFNEKDGIIVIAATNRLDTLDEALLRPGRFDRLIEVPLPCYKERGEILDLYLKDKPIGDINVDEISSKTVSFSGAKLESLVNEAAILACKEGSQLIQNQHFTNAYTNILAGAEKKDYSFLKEVDKKITSIHEGGHALISFIFLKEDILSKVTIIPTTRGAGGYTLSIPQDRLYHSKDYLIKRVMVLLAGRAAEEIIFGSENITTGSSNDLIKSSEIIKDMVTKYGMFKSMGLFSFGKTNTIDPVVINECKEILDSIYEEVKISIINNMDKLLSLSSKLEDVETLYKDEIYSILN